MPHRGGHRRDGDEPGAAPAPTPAGAQVSTTEVDDLLDEIDDVLETDAQEYVKSFVHKGGQ